MFHYFFEKTNRILEKGMPLLTPSGVLAGFLLGARISHLAPIVTYLFAFITLTGALTMSARDFVSVIRKPLPIFVFLFVSRLAIPVIVTITARFFFSDDIALVTGFVLLFSIPTAVAGFIWTSIHKGNGPLSLSIILLDTLLAPILTPATVSILMGSKIAIDGSGMFASLVLMVVIPSAVGIFVNALSKGEVPRTVVPFFKPLSKIGLLTVISINTSRIAPTVTAFEPVFIKLAIVCIAFSLLGFFLGALGAKSTRLSYENTVTVMYASGLRNISASLVLALQFFEPRVSLPIVTGILFQQTLAAFAGFALKRTTQKKDGIAS